MEIVSSIRAAQIYTAPLVLFQNSLNVICICVYVCVCMCGRGCGGGAVHWHILPP